MMSKSSISLLAKAVSNKCGLNQAEAERFIAKMFEVAQAGLDEDKLVKMKWLGTFKVTAVKERESVDVNTGERILIEGRDKISFTPDNIIKEIINKPFEQFETVVVNEGVDFSDIDEKFAKMEDEGVSEISEETPATSDAMAFSDVPAAVEMPVSTPAVLDSVSSLVSDVAKQAKDIADDAKDIVDNAKDVKENSDSVPPVVNFFLVENDASDSEEGSKASDEVVVISDEFGKKIISVNSDEAENQDQLEAVESSTDSPAADFPAADSPVEESSSVEPSTSELPPMDKLPLAESPMEVPALNKHHFVIPKYVIVIAFIVILGLVGGLGWFAFNYGMIQAQRDMYANALHGYMTRKVKTQPNASVPLKSKTSAKLLEDSAQAALRKKAMEDSIRMSAARKAIEKAEEFEQIRKTKDSVALVCSAQKYDDDPRVRTGAYRIVGVASTVTVKEGESLVSISKRYLGPDMECYVEAVNDVKQVKAGQKIKIPKLKLKKRNNK